MLRLLQRGSCDYFRWNFRKLDRRISASQLLVWQWTAIRSNCEIFQFRQRSWLLECNSYDTGCIRYIRFRGALITVLQVVHCVIFGSGLGIISVEQSETRFAGRELRAFYSVCSRWPDTLVNFISPTICSPGIRSIIEEKREAHVIFA